MGNNGGPPSVEAAVSAAFPKILQATRPFGYRLQQALPLQCPRPAQRRHAAFTLAELLVATSVLVLLVFLASQLLNTATVVTTLGHKQMDADSQARQLLDRMTIDFEQMVKRSDVDYYLKSSQFAFGTPPAPPPPPVITGVRTLLQPGNDQIAFYSAVPGYYPAGSQSPVSLVAYRVNSNSASSSYNKMERFGQGLVWNAVSTAIPVVFMPIPVASALPVAELPPSPTPTPSPSPAWPQAGNMTPDAAYELVGPQVFRFEYYYLLKGQVVTGTTYNPIFSDAPLDTRISGHAKVSGMQDVSAIVVDVAVIDSKSKVLISDCILAKLNGAPPPAGCTPAQQLLIDWGNTTCAGCPTQTQWQTTPGLLAAQWRSAIDANTVGAPRQAVSGIRVYERFIYLSSPVQ